MLIKGIKISNYRNLSGINIISKSRVQYIFGDNGVGKSNLLELLNTIFNRNAFSENDFNNLSQKIEVNLTLMLNDLELGYFDDFFEPENENEIIISVVQENPNGRIEFRHEESDSIIPYSKIKGIPFVYYNSVQAPDELNFNKPKTTGKFLNSIIQRYIELKKLKSEDFISTEKMDEVITGINRYIEKISLIKTAKISAKIENDSTTLIPKLIGLSNEDNISINNMGSGLRYMSYIYFEILSTILKSIESDKNIKFVDKDGKTYIPLMIALDEPEIHLHPYMQRNLMKSILKILNNDDPEFSSLLLEYFEVDGIIGQIIITTHSPNILSNDYREYIRLYAKDKNIVAVSGDELDLGEYEKHLLQHILSIKECFFSKCVLVFEGISEAGTVPFFADKLGIDLDQYGIGIISANGEGSVRKIKILLDKFDIKAVAVIDKDCYKDSDKGSEILFTEFRDLECDIVEKIIKNEAVNELLEVINEYEENGTSKNIQKGNLENNNKKLLIKVDIDGDYSVNKAIETKNKDLLKLVLVSWLWWKKDMIRGRILGQIISSKNIPDVYVKAIEMAKKVVADE